MALSQDEIRHVALLARLKLDETEVEAFAGQLGKVLDYVRKLDELDTRGVEPMVTASADGNVFRPDRHEAGLTRQEALDQAPEKDEEFFRLPRVIE
jgi:aspartyl-tRNA(Asn)/glutamyl-tRNA(Gln) amidotransferase subunit C